MPEKYSATRKDRATSNGAEGSMLVANDETARRLGTLIAHPQNVRKDSVGCLLTRGTHPAGRMPTPDHSRPSSAIQAPGSAPARFMVAVVAHKLVSKRGKSSEAAASPIPPPFDQQLDRPRAPAFTPGMPRSATCRLAEHLIMADCQERVTAFAAAAAQGQSTG